MSALHGQPATEFDFGSARQAILRYQPASNWVSVSRDPTQRMTIGFGFDVSRPEASEMLQRVGLDPAAVRAGRMPVSDAQMDELFDLTLTAAVALADRRASGFADMLPEQRWALLELMLWLGPDGSEAMFNELKELSLPLTHEALEPSRWFDLPREETRSPGADVARPTAQRAPLPATASSADPPSRTSARSRCQITFESFGLVAELASDDPDLLDAAVAMLPPGWRAVDGRPSARFGIWTNDVITVNGARADRASHRGASLLKLGGIVRHYLATDGSVFTFVHAGVVDVAGCAIVIPGRSYTGKSTLVAELVRLGATYVSDEYAVLDASGLVQPFAKPLSIRAGRHDPLGRLVPVPQALVADHPVRAGLIVLTSYAPGAHWRPSVHSRAEGAFALLQNTVSARRRPDSALNATSRVARGADFLAGQRGEAAETARALLEAALLRSGSLTTVGA